MSFKDLIREPLGGVSSVHVISVEKRYVQYAKTYHVPSTVLLMNKYQPMMQKRNEEDKRKKREEEGKKKSNDEERKRRENREKQKRNEIGDGKRCSSMLR